MSARITFSTTKRVLLQLRHDRRTVAMVLGVPLVLITLVYYLFENQFGIFDRLGLIMLGLFPFIIMFIITSVAMLRERTTGTLERLLTTPLHKADLLFGYGLAFAIVASIQALASSALAYLALNLRTAGSFALVLLIAVCDAVLGMALGLFFSAFARTEFQAVQFMPAIVMPQLLLCGLFVPRSGMAGWMQGVSDAMPLTYAVDALQQLGSHTSAGVLVWRDLGIIAGSAVVAVALAAATLQRHTA
ncbi:MAG TPA: ABC transporter permease [Acidimicrobiales bacterium]|nr:ABC transporter permease [Acidimicrobiales bacterium]